MLLFCLSAQAASYYFVDSGTRAMARGGAFVVGADDQSAQYYNPAALGNIDRPMLNFNLWAVKQAVTFDRADEPGDDGALGTADDWKLAAVENGAPPIIEPTGGFVMPIRATPEDFRTTVALGLYLPSSPLVQYPVDGAQRYALTDALIWQVYAGPSVAQRITRYVTIGAGLQYTFMRVEQGLAATACFTDATCLTAGDDPNNDITLRLDTWDKMQWSGNFGVIVHPTPWLSVGGAVQPPISYSAPGSMTASFTEEFTFAGELNALSTSDPEVLLEVQVPLIVRSGVQVTPNDKVRVEADFVWTNWSTMDAFHVKSLDLTVEDNPDKPLLQDDIVVHDAVDFITGFQDAWSIRVGGDWKPTPALQLRAGAHYETSAVAPEYLTVVVTDGSKVGFGLGATYHVGQRLAFDVGFAEQIIFKQEVTNSKYQLQALKTEVVPPYNTDVLPGKVVGNGTFKANTTFVSLGATVYFGEAEDGKGS